MGKIVKYNIYDKEGSLKLEVRFNRKGSKAVKDSYLAAVNYSSMFDGGYVRKDKDHMSGSGHCDDCGAHWFVRLGTEAVCPICGEAGYQDMDWDIN